MKSHPLPFLYYVLVIFCVSTFSSEAISMQGDSTGTPTDYNSLHIQAAANYDSVGLVSAPGIFGSGTLVQSTGSNYQFLTAAHVVDLDYNGVIDKSQYTLFFGDNVHPTSGGVTSSVTLNASQVTLHPLWAADPTNTSNGFSQYDMALMTFDFSQISGVLPATASLTTANPLNQIGTFVGYGAEEYVGDFYYSRYDGKRRAGSNVIDLVGDATDDSVRVGLTIQTDFDNGLASHNSLGSPLPLLLESSTTVGDSGGPIYANGQVVGVLSGGFNPIDPLASSLYGDRSRWAWVGEDTNLNFLQSHGVVVAVPEPSAFTLALLAMTTFLRRHR